VSLIATAAMVPDMKLLPLEHCRSRTPERTDHVAADVPSAIHKCAMRHTGLRKFGRKPLAHSAGRFIISINVGQ
jgi:hypothetical protein